MLKLEKITKVFRSHVFSSARIHALSGVSLTVGKGTCLALVGESGSGKTTLARIALGMERPTTGQVSVDGINPFAGRATGKLRDMIQMIPQDSTMSLNPAMKVRKLLLEPIRIRGMLNGNANQIIEAALDSCKLTRDLLDRYPGELSGGQRQRVAIARTLSLSPSIIIADEPAASLDRSTQAHIMSILANEISNKARTMLLITHDLRLARIMAGDMAVLFCGLVMESGPSSNILERPVHPYTKLLAASAPGRSNKKVKIIHAEQPSPLKQVNCCPFHTRCPEKSLECERTLPPLKPVGNNRHARCFKANHLAER